MTTGSIIETVGVAASVTATLGSFAFWILSSRFASKAELDEVRELAQEAHAKHDLMGQPIKTLADAVGELKSSIDAMSKQAAERHESLMAKLADLHTRTTVLEKTGASRQRKR